MREISPAAAKWKRIGLALEIKPHELDKIKLDEPDSDCKLDEVVSLWLKGNGGERSVKFLCDALRSKLVGHYTLADEAEKELLPLVKN